MEELNLTGFENLEVKSKVEEVIPPVENITEEVIEAQEPIVEQQVENTQDDDVDPYSHFVEQLGLENFEITKELRDRKFDGLIDIAKYQIDLYKSELNDFKGNPDLIAYREHLLAGGTLDTYRQVASLNNEYDNIEIDDDNVEALAVNILKDIKGFDDDEEIQSVIDNRKDKGTLSDFVAKEIDKLRNARQKEIEGEQEKIESENSKSLREQETYFTDLNKAFEEINLFDKNIVKEVKALSLPDKTGKIAINDIWNNFDSKQTAIMHTIAYQLSKGQAIEYKPLGSKKVNFSANLLDKVVGKNQPIDKSVMSVDDLMSYVKKQ